MSAMHLAAETPAPQAASPWRVMIVDDDPEVHAVTRLALSDFSFEGRGLQVLGAHSAAEARELWRRESGIALVLLDVVMETDHAGLDFVHFVRNEQGDDKVRIVLRTGQPGQAPALEVIKRYEIDDYRTKTELTFLRLNVLVTTALRTYRLLQRMDERQKALEDSNRELERFAYFTSQDLQSPLRTLVTFSRLLESRYRETLDSGAGQMLDRVVAGAQDMEILIANLLEYSRVGRSDARFERVDLNRVIEATRRSTQGLIEQRGAVLEYDVLPQLEGNAELLEAMFCKLIDNAIRFQPEAPPSVRIEAEEQGDCWEIRVVDRGVGIDPQRHQSVFEPFRRIHSRERFRGTGISLAICRRVAEVHGGSIGLRSAPGQGTTVSVRLPKVQQRHHTGPADSGAA